MTRSDAESAAGGDDTVRLSPVVQSQRRRERRAQDASAGQDPVAQAVAGAATHEISEPTELIETTKQAGSAEMAPDPAPERAAAPCDDQVDALDVRDEPRYTRGRSRIAVRAGAGLGVALVAALGVGAGLTQAHKSVTIVVDGKASSASTFSGTVSEVLAQQQVSYSPADAVSPTAGAQLADGQTITVNTAKDLTVADGDRDATKTTTAYTAADAAADLTAERDSTIVVSRAGQRTGPALSLQLTKGQRLVVVDAGTPRTVTSTGGTIGSLLQAEGVTLKNEDSIELDATQAGEVQLVITRRHTEQRARTEKIAYGRVTTKDASEFVGVKKVTTEGVKGTKKIVEKVTVENGKVVETERVSAKVTKKPVAEVTTIGTKKRPAENIKASANSLNWGALARCESGGNPRSVSSSGLYHGLYQFSVATWRAVGGSGLPSQASAAEQTKRAKILYSRSGRGQWPHCGKLL